MSSEYIPFSNMRRARMRDRARLGEWTGIQKGGLIIRHLFAGEGMRTCDVADLMGVRKWDSAYRAMILLQRVMPEIRQDESGVWHVDFSQVSTP